MPLFFVNNLQDVKWIKRRWNFIDKHENETDGLGFIFLFINGWPSAAKLFSRTAESWVFISKIDLLQDVTDRYPQANERHLVLATKECLNFKDAVLPFL